MRAPIAGGKYNRAIRKMFVTSLHAAKVDREQAGETQLECHYAHSIEVAQRIQRDKQRNLQRRLSW
jgi:hypothetical protein